MDERSEHGSLESIISKTERLGWNKGKVKMEVNHSMEKRAKLLLIVFWVQVYGLPLDRQFKENPLRIGNFMGRAIDVDLSGDGPGLWKKYVKEVDGNGAQGELHPVYLSNEDKHQTEKVLEMLSVPNHSQILEDQPTIHLVSNLGISTVRGGLTLFWMKGVELEVIFVDKNVIAFLVYSDPPSSFWLFLAIYGPPTVSSRARFWGFLEDMANSFDGTWLAIGDFNSVGTIDEKIGGRKIGEGSSRSFRNFVYSVGAIDHDFSVPKFTWSNKRAGFPNIRERLDKGLCNQEWQCIFPKAGIKHLIASSSNHNPILLDTQREINGRARPFRFEAMWTKDVSSNEVVENVWQLQTRIKELEKRIAELQDQDPTRENLENEAALCLELDEWLEKEEVKWKQKSRELWLKEEDRNTKFFHLTTLVRRRRRNFIVEIRDDDGNRLCNMEEIRAYFTRKFVGVYQSAQPRVPANLDVLIQPCISTEENDEITRIPSEDEIKKIIFDMNPLKTPGPDGMPGFFYRHYWNIVGKQLVAATQNFFRDGWMLQKLTEALLEGYKSLQGAGMWDPPAVRRRSDMTVIGDRFFSTRAPAITKLFYADDVMLFCNAKMSEGLNEKLDTVVRRFWWSPKSDSQNYFTPMACAELCRPKDAGGLGFRRFEDINATLISKLVCWEDPWIPDRPDFKPCPSAQGINSSLVVSQLMTHSKTSWDINKLQELFDQESIEAILKIPLWKKNEPDKWEHGSVRRKTKAGILARRVVKWSLPNQGSLKINCHVAVGRSCAFIAVVVRNWRGSMVFALSKKVNTNVLVQAEAEAILWALYIASSIGHFHFVIESDSKLCIDAIIGRGSNIPLEDH
uniref:RNase H type-1 domain-containing protein n=1 Tax=Fagus sylvatica TaxID=28930 RepID=A0A2N9F3J3_FAGSY